MNPANSELAIAPDTQLTWESNWALHRFKVRGGEVNQNVHLMQVDMPMAQTHMQYGSTNDRNHWCDRRTLRPTRCCWNFGVETQEQNSRNMWQHQEYQQHSIATALTNEVFCVSIPSISTLHLSECITAWTKSLVTGHWPICMSE